MKKSVVFNNQFAPKLGGQFELESGGQFTPELVVNLHWKVVVNLTGFSTLHSQATFNNGLVDIKLIAKTFEEVFNIELGDFYRTYLELRNRKTNRTKFIDSLRDSLTRKMDEQDEE